MPHPFQPPVGRLRAPAKANTHVHGEPLNATPLEIAMNRAAKLTKHERAALFDATQHAFHEFRAGRGNLASWRRLVDANNIALELVRLRIASDHEDTFRASEGALTAVCVRFEAGGSWTLKAAEITALDDAVFVHGIQLQYCSRGELSSAVTRVMNRTRAALAGQATAGVTVCNPCAQAQKAAA